MFEMSKIQIPRITTELSVIQSQNNSTIDSLLREIAFLEKELSKEKVKNKELLALLTLLEEKRKELKKQYVA